MIKSAIVFFEHQIPFAKSLLEFVEAKHPVFLIKESLDTDNKNLTSLFPEFSITSIEKAELKTKIRAKRLGQIIFPLVPQREKGWLKRLQEAVGEGLPIRKGHQLIVKEAVERFKKHYLRSEYDLIDSSIEQLRRSLKVLVDDYEELILGGLCQSAPKADLLRAPCIMKKRPASRPMLELKLPLWPFPSKEGIVLKSDDPMRPETAQFVGEKIRRRS